MKPATIAAWFAVWATGRAVWHSWHGPSVVAGLFAAGAVLLWGCFVRLKEK